MDLILALPDLARASDVRLPSASPNYGAGPGPSLPAER